MGIMLTTFIIYLVFLIAVGLLTYNLNKKLDDFVLAGRRLKIWVATISEKASSESGWMILGMPGKGFNNGLGAIWPALACVIGTFFNWTALAWRLRKFTAHYKALSLPDFIEARYRDEKSKLLRIVAAILLIVFTTSYVSAQFIASAKALHVTFEMDYYLAFFIGVAVILFYTVMGGFFAVAFTDLVQGLLMVFALVLLPTLGIIHLGGWSGMLDQVGSIMPTHLSVKAGKHGLELATFIIGMLAIGLGYPGQPHVVTRYMAIQDPKKVRVGGLIAVAWIILAAYGAVFIGLSAKAIITQEITDPEHIFPLMAKALLPEWLVGILIAAAMAAIMSTADSQLLICSTTLVQDIFHKLLGKEFSDKTMVLASRLFTLGIGVIAVLLALTQDPDDEKGLVFWLVLYAWGGLASSFGPLLILSCFWKRTTKWGALAGMVIGSATYIVWQNINVLKELVYGLVPGFFVAFGAIIIVSLLTEPPGEIDREFEEMRKAM